MTCSATETYLHAAVIITSATILTTITSQRLSSKLMNTSCLVHKSLNLSSFFDNHVPFQLFVVFITDSDFNVDVLTSVLCILKSGLVSNQRSTGQENKVTFISVLMHSDNLKSSCTQHKSDLFKG